MRNPDVSYDRTLYAPFPWVWFELVEIQKIRQKNNLKMIIHKEKNHKKTTLEDEVLEAYTDYVEERLISVTLIDFQPDFLVVISAFLIVKMTLNMISLIEVVEIWSVRVC